MTGPGRGPGPSPRVAVHGARSGYVSEPARERYVHPGHVLVSAEGLRLSTVLGSCVSVCIFDLRARVGGMNHFVLPEESATGSGSTRFAGPAIQALIRETLAVGADRRRLEAKVFGGTSRADHASNGFHVGSRNVEVARRLLAADDIPIVRDDVGGSRGRKLVFCTDDGAAWVRLL